MSAKKTNKGIKAVVVKPSQTEAELRNTYITPDEQELLKELRHETDETDFFGETDETDLLGVGG